MKKIWNWLKRDFINVSFAVSYLTNDKMPKWAIAIWYVVMFPIGIIITPFLAIWLKYQIYKLERDLSKYMDELEES